jgi:hypothetical protein
MKTLIAFASFALSLNCLASVAVGDFAEYGMAEGRRTYFAERKVESVEAEKGTVTILSRTDLTEYRSVEKIADLETLMAAGDSIENCQALLQTFPRDKDAKAAIVHSGVDGKNMDLCYLFVAADQLWVYGNVPFGLVSKEIRADDPEARLVASLIRFEKK